MWEWPADHRLMINAAEHFAAFGSFCLMTKGAEVVLFILKTAESCFRMIHVNCRFIEFQPHSEFLTQF